MIHRQIADRIARSPLAHRFFSAWESGTPLSFTSVQGSLGRILTALAFEKSPATYVVIVSTKERAEYYREDLELFLGEEVAVFPAYDRYFLFDEVQNQDVLISRLRAYQRLLRKRHSILLAEGSSLLYPVIPPEELALSEISFVVGQKIIRDQVVGRLIDSGFNREKMVGEAGEISVRGSVIDIFSPTMENPVRIEFDFDDIVSIREFDIGTQRSVRQVHEVSFLPFRKDILISGEANPATLFDYFPGDARVIVEEPLLLKRRMNDYIREAEQYRISQGAGNGHEMPKLFSPDSVLERLSRSRHISFSTLPIPDTEHIDFESSAPPPIDRNMNTLKIELDKLHTSPRRYATFVLCDNKGQVERLRDIVAEEEFNHVPVIDVGSFHEGFIFPDGATAVFNDHEIFHRTRWRRGRIKPHSIQKFLADRSLNIGDLIVHEDHGIGRFLGLQRIKVGKSEQECLKLEYQDNDILFLHLDKLHRIEKYSAQEGVTPVLSKLGTTDWERLKARTKKSIKNIARELIRLYAQRKVAQGFQFPPDTTWLRELEAAFEFEETPDQLRAVMEVKEDMERARPMDRLVCGDVGYGKTEVALRAGFKAATNGKQVALLVPTTILAQQHYETFHRRLEPFPVRVEVLSRFRSRKEQTEVVSDLKEGKVDIVIGTHRLLSKDVGFKDLGLVIVDEEHRFGVRHKERLKELKKEVDVLTLTATPIPRTLSMSLMGARDFSVIETPPKNRLPIITEIIQFRDDIIRNAIMREIDRGGQIYFVHNRVKTIDGIAARIRKIVPGVRLGIAHGQMRERELESIMISFLKRDFDVLISTMIIESGLDIPNVNTIVIHHAENFGLAQLYQLRGRVGRSSVQAYAYLVVQDFANLDDISIKRLQTIAHHTELGSGLQISMRDLEIRGAGNILGSEQSGFINAVGFDLYNKILDKAVYELWHEEGIQGAAPLRQEREPGDVKVRTDRNAYFPDDYLPDAAERVSMYRQLIEIKSTEDMERFRSELEDRFGRMPEPAETLMDIMVLKILACKLGIVSLSLYGTILRLDFYSENDKEQLPGALRNFIEGVTYNFYLYQDKDVGIQIQLPDRSNGASGLRETRELLHSVLGRLGSDEKDKRH